MDVSGVDAESIVMQAEDFGIDRSISFFWKKILFFARKIILLILSLKIFDVQVSRGCMVWWLCV